MRKGIGYYHFNRLAAGDMKCAPNFNLAKALDVIFFIDPHVLLKHHFIVCRGNVAKNSRQDAPGRLDSKMTEEQALMEALRAVEKLQEIIRERDTMIPTRNEIGIFEYVESEFVYPNVGMLMPDDPADERQLRKRVESV